MAAVISPPSHGLKIGRKTSSRCRGTSRQRVGRLSYIVSAERVTQKRARASPARLRARDDVRLRRRLLLEVAPDHGRELIERLEDGEVEVREKVGWEDHQSVSVV